MRTMSSIEEKDIQSLLDSVSVISGKYDLLYERTGEKFNIFKILGVDKKEVLICRLLRELLSPKGSHCQGTLYLKLFVRDVLNKHLTNSLLECEFEAATTVDCEFCTENKRRVDLVIQTHKPSRRFIPIEVKITAKDQPLQVRDYFNEAKDFSDDKENVKLFYLTRFGYSPDPKSCEKLEVGKDVICISFKDDILPWLKDCLQHPKTTAPIREVLQQFIVAIEGFTNQQEDKMKKDVLDMLQKNLKSAVTIKEYLPEALRELEINFFDAVAQRVLDKKQVNAVDDEYHYSHALVESDSNEYPSLNYRFKDDEVVRFDIEAGKAYVGYFNPETKRWRDDWKKIMELNFSSPNEIVYEMCESEEKFKDIVELCVNDIVAYLIPQS